MGNQGERVELVDRKICIELIEEAVVAGATLAAASAILEISVRTVERWKNRGNTPDGRMGPTEPSLKSLSNEEVKMIIDVCNLTIYRDLCPWKIISKLADSVTYLGSESCFYLIASHR